MSKQLSEPQGSSILVAVSGGVDSISLLHILASTTARRHSTYEPDLLANFLEDSPISKIEAAYINHGQRKDTHLDFQVIQAVCKKFNLKLNYVKLNLPSNCSENLARKERYNALNLVLKKRELDHLVTAHHADDVIETALINLMRGTGPKGLCSLQHQPNEIWRPFIHGLLQQETRTPIVNKQLILDYAQQNKLTWNEDSTNHSDQYLRNKVRKRLHTSSPRIKKDLLNLSISTLSLTRQMDCTLDQFIKNIQASNQIYSISKLLELPKDVQPYLIHALLTKNCREVSARAVKETLAFLKTKQTNKLLQLRGAQIIVLSKKRFKFLPGTGRINSRHSQKMI